jgi:hypothetical protein
MPSAIGRMVFFVMMFPSFTCSVEKMVKLPFLISLATTMQKPRLARERRGK